MLVIVESRILFSSTHSWQSLSHRFLFPSFFQKKNFLGWIYTALTHFHFFACSCVYKRFSYFLALTNCRHSYIDWNDPDWPIAKWLINWCIFFLHKHTHTIVCEVGWWKMLKVNVRYCFTISESCSYTFKSCCWLWGRAREWKGRPEMMFVLNNINMAWKLLIVRFHPALERAHTMMKCRNGNEFALASQMEEYTGGYEEMEKNSAFPI